MRVKSGLNVPDYRTTEMVHYTSLPSTTASFLYLSLLGPRGAISCLLAYFRLFIVWTATDICVTWARISAYFNIHARLILIVCAVEERKSTKWSLLALQEASLIVNNWARVYRVLRLKWLTVAIFFICRCLKVKCWQSYV